MREIFLNPQRRRFAASVAADADEQRAALDRGAPRNAIVECWLRLEAAVIAAKHEKWDERPLLIVVPKPGREISEADLLKYYEGKVAKWWIPDAVQFVEAIPKGATGKILKTALRDQYSEVLLSR